MAQFGLPEKLDVRWCRMGYFDVPCMSSMMKFYTGYNTEVGGSGQHWALETSGVTDGNVNGGGFASSFQFFFAQSENLPRVLVAAFNSTNGESPQVEPGGLQLFTPSVWSLSGNPNQYFAQFNAGYIYNAGAQGGVAQLPSYSLPTMESGAFIYENFGINLTNSPISYKSGGILPMILYSSSNNGYATPSNSGTTVSANTGFSMLTSGTAGTAGFWASTNTFKMTGSAGTATGACGWICPGTSGTSTVAGQQTGNTPWATPSNPLQSNTVAPLGYVCGPGVANFGNEYEVSALFFVTKDTNIPSGAGDFIRFNLGWCFGGSSIVMPPLVTTAVTSPNTPAWEPQDGRAVVSTLQIPGVIVTGLAPGTTTLARNANAMNFWVPVSGSFSTNTLTSCQTAGNTVTKATATTDLLRILCTLGQNNAADQTLSAVNYTINLMRLTIRQIAGINPPNVW